MNNSNCQFCASPIEPIKGSDDYKICDCPLCGKYEISGSAFGFALPSEIINKKHLISGYIRELNDSNLRVERIGENSYESILRSARIPKNLNEKINKMLLYFYRNTEYFGQEIKFPVLSIGYLKNREEYFHVISQLFEDGYIVSTEEKIATINNILLPDKYSLSHKGTLYVENMQKPVIDSKIAFIAMSYDVSLQSVYEQHISKAIEDSGYRPSIMYDNEFNEAIYDQIVAEIRKSKFIVADFTGKSPNVYYEAGFAYELGLKVIYTCREDQKADIKFDIKHNNFIFWKDGEDLYERLKKRIEATIK